MENDLVYTNGTPLNTIESRIEWLLKETGMTQSSFANRINENPTKFSHIFKGRNRPSLDLITKIVSAFPEVSVEWLIKGEGKALNGNISTDIPGRTDAYTSSGASQTEAMKTANFGMVERNQEEGLLPFDTIEHNEIKDKDIVQFEPERREDGEENRRMGKMEEKQMGNEERPGSDKEKESGRVRRVAPPYIVEKTTPETEQHSVLGEKRRMIDQKEERAPFEGDTDSGNYVQNWGKPVRGKKIKRVIILYEDNSFDDFVR